MHSEEKPMAGHMIIEKRESFHDEVKIADKCTFSEGSNKKLFRSIEVLYDYPQYLIIQHLSGSVGGRIQEFYSILFLIVCYIYIYELLQVFIGGTIKLCEMDVIFCTQFLYSL
jgi:hypothetical protein